MMIESLIPLMLNAYCFLIFNINMEKMENEKVILF